MEQFIKHFAENPMEAFLLISGQASAFGENADKVMRAVKFLSDSESIRFTAGYWM